MSTQGEGSLLQLLGLCSWFRITAEGFGFWVLLILILSLLVALICTEMRQPLSVLGGNRMASVQAASSGRHLLSRMHRLS